MNTFLIGILSITTVLITAMLIHVIIQKNKLIRQREQGIVDQYMLSSKFENVVKRIIALKQNDSIFSDEIKKIYFEEIDNYLEKVSVCIDNEEIPSEKQLLTYEQFCELIYAAIKYIKASEKLSNKTIYTSPGKFLLEIKSDKIEFNTKEFDKTIFTPKTLSEK